MSAQKLQNVGIIILQDGTTPCITLDSLLPHPLKHIEFNRNDYLLTFVYNTKEDTRDTLDYPLAHELVEMLSKRKDIVVAQVQKGQVSDFKLFPIVFVEK